jgi:hypothetical protein
MKSNAFETWAKNNGVEIQYSVPDVSQMDGTAEKGIGDIKRIARPLLHCSNLPPDQWGPIIEAAADLKNIRPNASLGFRSPEEEFSRSVPRVDHWRVVGCKVNVPIYKRGKRGGGLGSALVTKTYVGAHSPSVIRTLDTVNLGLGYYRFDDAQFFEDIFPGIQGKICSQYEEDMDDPLPANHKELLELSTQQALDERTRLGLDITVEGAPNALTETAEVAEPSPVGEPREQDVC